jgi:hypothetical protein
MMRRQYRRRAAAEVDVLNPVPSSQRRGDEVQLTQHQIEIGGDRLVAPGHRGVTGAIPAEAMAERQVDVERERQIRRQCPEPAAILRRPDAGVKVRRRRVARIARHSAIVPGEQLRSHGERFYRATMMRP